MRITYEIRTRRGTPVHRFDNEQRARQEMAYAAKRVGIDLHLVRITQTEEEI